MIPRSTTNTPINPDDPLVGRTIEGKFLIESLVGEGAMGAVYRARHLTLEKPVAVKIMHAEHACTESFAARFQREARAASRLDHPNSVRVIDFGRAPDGLLYLVMELLEGRDLFATIEEDWPLSSERVVSLLSQTLAALAAAHDAGVIHRDVKPENVMVLSGTTEDGAPADLVKVCDFGIARVAEVKEERVLSGRRRITGIGVAVGTPEYMSPEQAMGAEVDARTDLYSAGVVLFQMLTKRVPFTSSTPMGVAMMHLTDPPPEITTLAPHAHPGLVSVCERAMAKSPADRFQTAREMRSALRGVLDRAASGPPSLRASAMTSASTSARRRFDPATPTVAEHPGPSETPRSPARVRPIAVALVALGVGVLSLGAARRASTQSPPAATRTLESSPIEPPPTELKTTEWSSPAPPSPTPVSLSIVRPRLRPTRLAAATAEPATAQETPPKSSAPVPQATTPPAPALQPAVGDPEPPPALAPHATAEPPPPPSENPPLDVSRARVTIAGVSTTSALAGASVRSALTRADFLSCYRSALTAAGSAVVGTARLHLQIDSDGYVTSASASGASFLGTAAACVTSRARGLRIQNVDTGDATAEVTIVFSISPSGLLAARSLARKG